MNNQIPRSPATPIATPPPVRDQRPLSPPTFRPNNYLEDVSPASLADALNIQPLPDAPNFPQLNEPIQHPLLLPNNHVVMPAVIPNNHFVMPAVIPNNHFVMPAVLPAPIPNNNFVTPQASPAPMQPASLPSNNSVRSPGHLLRNAQPVAVMPQAPVIAPQQPQESPSPLVLGEPALLEHPEEAGLPLFPFDDFDEQQGDDRQSLQPRGPAR